jgi:two-component system, chemotaxis family, sensor kinase CheA
MSNDEFDQQMLTLFAAEADEYLQALTAHCLALEQQPATAEFANLLIQMLRATHSLKGSARAVGLTDIATLIHRLENLFEQIQAAGGPPPTTVFDLIYRTLDGTKSLIQAALTNIPSEVVAQEMLSQLETAVTDRSIRTASAPRLAPAAGLVEHTAVANPDETIRVTTARLDALLNRVNELQVTRLDLERGLAGLHQMLYESERGLLSNGQAHTGHGRLSQLYHHFETSYRQLNQHLAQLQADVRQTRLLPLSTLFQALSRLARDLAHDLGKQVTVQVEGGHVAVDRSVLEQIKAPLQHLLHNAVDHGLETPVGRQDAGKVASGTIRLTAVQRGSSLLIEISDDGAGIDPARVRAQAVHQGLLTATEAKALTEEEAAWLIFRSGFTMTTAVSDISGRGIGLDVVRQAVEQMQGQIVMTNRPGQGVCFTLSLPLSLATTFCLLLGAGGQHFALPARRVQRLLPVQPHQLRRENGRFLFRTNETEIDEIPALVLADLLQLNRPGFSDRLEGQERQTAVIIGPSTQPAALLVDGLGDVRELVIKKCPPPFNHVPYISGAAILGTGQVILALNSTDLLREAKHHY